MANNTNCRQCDPIPQVCVNPPQACDECNCEEIYSGECVTYTGPNIDCLGITNGMSLNDALQIIAERLCVEGCCINPIDWFLALVLEIYAQAPVLVAEEPVASTPPAVNETLPVVIETLLTTGIVMPKCNFCCPDCGVYYLGNQANLTSLIGTTGYVCCTNCGPDYQSCRTTLSEIGPCMRLIFNDLQEYGTLGGNSMLCHIYEAFNTYDRSVICSIFETIQTLGLVVSCNTPNGALIISSTETFENYFTNMGMLNNCGKHK